MRSRNTGHITDKAKHPISTICVTGGPCSGVSTAIVTLSSVLTKHGFKVYTVPDADQILSKGGACLKNI